MYNSTQNQSTKIDSSLTSLIFSVLFSLYGIRAGRDWYRPLFSIQFQQNSFNSEPRFQPRNQLLPVNQKDVEKKINQFELIFFVLSYTCIYTTLVIIIPTSS